MLLLLPPSERKSAPDAGPPLDLDRLSFPELTPTRVAVMHALTEVNRDLDVRTAPTAAAGTVYSGAMYAGLAYPDLDAATRRRAASWVVVVSALFGALRLADRIPAYRLHMCSRLPDLGHLPQVWQPALADALPGAVREGLVVDFRAAEYATAWRPRGALAAATVVVRIVRSADGRRGSASHPSLRTRGLVARQILATGLDPTDAQELAGALGSTFDVALHPARRAGGGGELDVVEV